MTKLESLARMAPEWAKGTEASLVGTREIHPGEPREKTYELRRNGVLVGWMHGWDGEESFAHKEEVDEWMNSHEIKEYVHGRYPGLQVQISRHGAERASIELFRRDKPGLFNSVVVQTNWGMSGSYCVSREQLDEMCGA